MYAFALLSPTRSVALRAEWVIGNRFSAAEQTKSAQRVQEPSCITLFKLLATPSVSHLKLSSLVQCRNLLSNLARGSQNDLVWRAQVVVPLGLIKNYIQPACFLGNELAIWGHLNLKDAP